MKEIISSNALKRRSYWVKEIRKLSGNFKDDFARLQSELEKEIKKSGLQGLIDHLRLCGDIPESYGHDSSEEKLYSKYTDALLALSYEKLGIRSIVLKERGDAADVEAFAKGFSFVADAKCFRLSRTAKNSKDFKVTSMDTWKRGKPYAMLVCPIYQLPKTNSQIYEQAFTRNVCIFTYSHLAVILGYSKIDGKQKAQFLMKKIFSSIKMLNPSKSSREYWLLINKTMLSFSKKIAPLWAKEKIAAVESVQVAKEEGLFYLASERERIMRMTRNEALKALIDIHRIESKIKIIEKVTDSGIFSLS